MEKITVNAIIKAPKDKVWEYYTQPKHITQWNFADPSWHCPYAENDLVIGGKYMARMEAKDGSFGFDFITIYTSLEMGSGFSYVMEDGRNASIELKELDPDTEVIICFDPESENAVDLQKDGWQSILNNFKQYSEAQNS